jgi:uncharacterized protein YbaR (Trm112 family)
MRPEFVPRLQCPMCKSKLLPHGFAASTPGSDDIEQGVLVCRGCSLPYPIIDGIPLLLPNSFTQNTQFTRQFARELAGISFRKRNGQDSRAFEKLQALTASAFGYEWNTYKNDVERRGRSYVLLANRRRPLRLREDPCHGCFHLLPHGRPNRPDQSRSDCRETSTRGRSRDGKISSAMLQPK